jgi:hypothetical protein
LYFKSRDVADYFLRMPRPFSFIQIGKRIFKHVQSKKGKIRVKRKGSNYFFPFARIVKSRGAVYGKIAIVSINGTVTAFVKLRKLEELIEKQTPNVSRNGILHIPTRMFASPFVDKIKSASLEWIDDGVIKGITDGAIRFFNTDVGIPCKISQGGVKLDIRKNGFSINQLRSLDFIGVEYHNDNTVLRVRVKK